MKRRILCFLLAVMLFVSLSICTYGAEDLVTDRADLLTDLEEQDLEQFLWEISQKVGAQIVVVTMKSVTNDDVDAFINYLYDDRGYGYGESKSGVLLLVCMNLRQYRILSNGYAGDVIGDIRINSIGDKVAIDLANGEYADAFRLFGQECEYYLGRNGGEFSLGFLPLPRDMGQTLLISFGIGLAVAIIVMVILKGQLKSVHPQHQADAYIMNGSMHVTTARDIFLYRNVTKTRKQTNSSSGGSRGGGSRHVGGGSF